ncbi:MAG: hypothetical protein CMJ34_08465 [Phycisphaerae bacterium]|nr:hypothetical protein [Phycisphaerae bacterium]
MAIGARSIGRIAYASLMNDTDHTTTPLFLAVGHCGPDGWMLRTAIQRVIPEAVVEDITGEAGLDERLGRAADRPVVLLVNRKLDGDFDAVDGIELIERRRDGRHVSMLVTNLPDAAAAAEAAGALPGFGKSDLHGESTSNALREAVEAAVTRGPA